MPGENVDLLRSLYEAWGRGDFSSAQWAHPDIEFVIADGPSPRSWKGLPGLAEGFREFIRDWEEWRAEADEYIELDGERILVLNTVIGRGKVSGLEIGELRGGASLYHFRAGKVTRLAVYLDRKHALIEAGLAGDAGQRE